MKHGLRAALPILPGEDVQQFQQLLEAWTDELRPETDLERQVVESMVLASWRLDRCRRAETAALTQQVLKAQEGDPVDDAHKVEREASFLALRPETTVRTLRQSSGGCRWLLGRWRMLAEALRDRTAWVVGELHLALNLLGKAPRELFRYGAVTRLYATHLGAIVGNADVKVELMRGFLEPDRPGEMTREEFEYRLSELTARLPTRDEGREVLGRLVREQVVALEEHLGLVEAREERDRLLAVQAAGFDGSATGAARLRYEMAAFRVFRSSLRDLRVEQERRRDVEDAGDLAPTSYGGPEPMPADVTSEPGDESGMTASGDEPTFAPSEPERLAAVPDRVAAATIAPSEPERAAEVEGSQAAPNAPENEVKPSNAAPSEPKSVGEVAAATVAPSKPKDAGVLTMAAEPLCIAPSEPEEAGHVLNPASPLMGAPSEPEEWTQITNPFAEAMVAPSEPEVAVDHTAGAEVASQSAPSEPEAGPAVRGEHATAQEPRSGAPSEPKPAGSLRNDEGSGDESAGRGSGAGGRVESARAWASGPGAGSPTPLAQDARGPSLGSGSCDPRDADRVCVPRPGGSWYAHRQHDSPAHSSAYAPASRSGG